MVERAVLFLVQHDFKGLKHFDPSVNNLSEQNISLTCCGVLRSLGVLATSSFAESVNIRSAGEREHVIVLITRRNRVRSA